MEQCRVLVVEDHEDVRQLIETVLIHQGFRVETVTDARKARRLLERHGYHLAIVDVTLPGREDGISLSQHLGPKVSATILITGNHSNLDNVQQSGVPYLLKPFRLRELSALVAAVLHRSNPPCWAPMRVVPVH